MIGGNLDGSSVIIFVISGDEESQEWSSALMSPICSCIRRPFPPGVLDNLSYLDVLVSSTALWQFEKSVSFSIAFDGVCWQQSQAAIQKPTLEVVGIVNARPRVMWFDFYYTVAVWTADFWVNLMSKSVEDIDST